MVLEDGFQGRLTGIALAVAGVVVVGNISIPVAVLTGYVHL